MKNAIFVLVVIAVSFFLPRRSVRPIEANFPGSNGAILFNRDDDIFRINVDGTGTVNLTNNPGADGNPAWSPDGSKIAFATRRYRGNQTDVAVMNADGSNVTRLTNLTNENGNFPEWSPDGSRIAFLGDESVYTMKNDGSDVKKIFTQSHSAPNKVSWKPDGTLLAVGLQNGLLLDIYTMKPDGSNLINLTQTSSRFNANSDPDWSPDGRQIVFTGSRTGDETAGMYLMNADGSNQRKLPTGFQSGSPAFAPDGTRIAFTLGDASDILTVLVDGSDFKYVTHFGVVGSAGGNAWQPINNLDADSDGINIPNDNCPDAANVNQLNHDGDTLGDACDPDDDNDGYTDVAELALKKDPFTPCVVMRADVDGDHDVTILDLAVLAQNFQLILPAFDPRLNQGTDDAISILDLSAMATVFGQFVSSCP